MGQSGSLRAMYGWILTEQEADDFEEETGYIFDLVRVNSMDFDFGGDLSSDDSEIVVGYQISPWMMDFGIVPLEDGFGHVTNLVEKTASRHIEYFGREPRKYLVMSYG